MANNDAALRRWVLKFLSLGADDQQSIRSSLSVAEKQQLDVLLEQADALGLSKNTSIIEEVLATDTQQYDRYAFILKTVADHLPPAWLALLQQDMLSDKALAAYDASYYGQYRLYRKKFEKYHLAPAMQATLQQYFHEQISNADNK